jgi:murein DD-endopeptidase MepM/ murein hydrolase activator NlpD
MSLSVRLENLSTQYFSELPGSTAQILDHSKIDEFIGEVREITQVLNEFEEMKEMSESQIVKFKIIRENLSEYLEYVPSYWPTERTYIASHFGMRWHPIYNDLREHTGMDIGGAYGDDIYAAASGEVIFSRYDSGYGYTVRIDHGNGLTTVYAHCSKLLAKEGETVGQGQLIAKIGSTGVSTGSHLHFEVRIDNVPVNPLPFISNEEVK